ncbi:MAG: hypothetical protein J5762_02530 [Clostridia bacterium]|nr:hypothetical protein [Clostridia bacterium]
MRGATLKIAAIVAIIALYAGFCTACAPLKSFEKDVRITAVKLVEQTDGDGNVTETTEEYAVGSVNIFNNWILPAAPSAKNEKGDPFLGWSLKKDFTSGTDDNSLLFNANGIIRYNDVKDYAEAENVTLYAIYQERVIIRNYLTVGYYERESTSGLNEDRVTAFVNNLKAYLKEQGSTDEQLQNVVIKGYNGNVSTVGQLVNDDGNVDIILGMGKNIQSQGGIVYIERETGLIMGGKTERCIALLYESEVARLAYNWMVENAGQLAD